MFLSTHFFKKKSHEHAAGEGPSFSWVNNLKNLKKIKGFF
jgi:hypothetical protein